MANRDNRNRDQGQQRGPDKVRDTDMSKKHDTERGSGSERMKNRSDESDRSSSDRLKDAGRLPE